MYIYMLIVYFDDYVRLERLFSRFQVRKKIQLYRNGIQFI